MHRTNKIELCRYLDKKLYRVCFCRRTIHSLKIYHVIHKIITLCIKKVCILTKVISWKQKTYIILRKTNTNIIMYQNWFIWVSRKKNEDDYNKVNTDLHLEGMEVIVGTTWIKTKWWAFGIKFSTAHITARRLSFPPDPPARPLTATATDVISAGEVVVV